MKLSLLQNMFSGRLGNSVIIIKLDAYSSGDKTFVEQFFHAWLNMANKMKRNEAIRHLWTVTTNNNLALSESSYTISLKWMDLMTSDPVWAIFFQDAPFKFSIEKVI